MLRRLFLLPVLALGVCLALLPARTSGSPDVLAQRKLLTDRSASVRLRAALTLAAINDPEAVSTLIRLLAELPEESAREAEAFLTELAGEQAPKVAVGSDLRSREKARDTWARWWKDNDGTALLKELEKRIPTGPVIARVEALISKLGDDNFDVREEAEAELKKMGPRIRPLLKAALSDRDLEVRKRSQQIVTAMKMDSNTLLSPTVPRLLAIRKPKGAVEALLAYLPFAGDESLLDELQNALNAVAYPDGKAHPDVVKALTDKRAARRAAAAIALCHGARTEQRPAVRKLLEDPDAEVRLRTALALAGAKDPEAVPVLIRLVGELSAEGASRAEEYLFELAGEKLPKDLPDGEDDRPKRSKRWQAWYEENRKTLVMPGRAERQRGLGYTLIMMWGAARIFEVDRRGKVRWEIEGVFARDAHVLSDGRVLVAEPNAEKVSERNVKGEVLWERSLPGVYPRQVERLKSGNTFVVGMGTLVELTRDGREVFRIKRLNDILTARKLPNGQIALITRKWAFLRLDTRGNVLKTAQLQYPSNAIDRHEILDNGGVLVAIPFNNTVIEYNPDGKVVRTFRAKSPYSVVRLPSGNLLLTEGEGKVVEINRDGRKVWEYDPKTGVGLGAHRARRR